MNRHDTHRSKVENSRDEGFILATNQAGAKVDNGGKIRLNTTVQNNGRDDSDDVETEKAERYAESM